MPFSSEEAMKDKVDKMTQLANISYPLKLATSVLVQ